MMFCTTPLKDMKITIKFRIIHTDPYILRFEAVSESNSLYRYLKFTILYILYLYICMHVGRQYINMYVYQNLSSQYTITVRNLINSRCNGHAKKWIIRKKTMENMCLNQNEIIKMHIKQIKGANDFLTQIRKKEVMAPILKQ